MFLILVSRFIIFTIYLNKEYWNLKLDLEYLLHTLLLLLLQRFNMLCIFFTLQSS